MESSKLELKDTLYFDSLFLSPITSFPLDINTHYTKKAFYGQPQLRIDAGQF